MYGELSNSERFHGIIQGIIHDEAKRYVDIRHLDLGFGVSVSDLGNAEILAWLRLTVIEESTEWLLLGIGEVPWRKVQKSILENGGL